MDNIKQIRLSKTDFIVELEGSSLKLNYQTSPEKYIVDISNMNLINAVKLAIMCSTYCFIKDFKKKICWLVKDEEIRRAISVLRLRNIEQIAVSSLEESAALAS